jgi:hypothetical protein
MSRPGRLNPAQSRDLVPLPSTGAPRAGPDPPPTTRATSGCVVRRGSGSMVTCGGRRWSCRRRRARAWRRWPRSRSRARRHCGIEPTSRLSCRALDHGSAAPGGPSGRLPASANRRSRGQDRRVSHNATAPTWLPHPLAKAKTTKCCDDPLRSPEDRAFGSGAGASPSIRPSLRPPVGVLRVPVPAGGNHGRGPLVPALRAVLPRRGGAAGRVLQRPRHGVPVGAAVHPVVRRRRPPPVGIRPVIGDSSMRPM